MVSIMLNSSFNGVGYGRILDYVKRWKYRSLSSITLTPRFWNMSTLQSFPRASTLVLVSFIQKLCTLLVTPYTISIRLLLSLRIIGIRSNINQYEKNVWKSHKIFLNSKYARIIEKILRGFLPVVYYMYCKCVARLCNTPMISPYVNIIEKFYYRRNT